MFCSGVPLQNSSWIAWHNGARATPRRQFPEKEAPRCVCAELPGTESRDGGASPSRDKQHRRASWVPLVCMTRADVPPPVRLRGGFKWTARSTPVVGGMLLAGFQKGGCLEPSICHLNEDGALPIRARAFRPDHALVSILSIFFRRRHDYPTLSQPSRIVPKTARLRVMSNTLCSFSGRATAASLGDRDQE